ncbi:MAG: copper-binding protein [Pseudomonadota bacterium]
MTVKSVVASLIMAATMTGMHPAFAMSALAMEGLEEPSLDTRISAQEEAVLSDAPLAAGRVVAVDPDAGRITLEYRPMPHLFLYGGTRVFGVTDPASLTGLGPGDKVRFDVEREGRTYTVTRILHSN